MPGRIASGDDLASTRYLETTHPAIHETARRVTAGAQGEAERAIRLHDFVRDEIRFGWADRFDDQTASQVLASGVGFCNTKSTLFVALLRAAGIPARAHFVGLTARLLDGLIDPRSDYVDHSYTEVRLEGRWLKVDSYIVDSGLHRQATARLLAAGRLVGYGVHAHGTTHWDGRTDSFAQFVDDGAVPNLSDVDFGVFDDVDAFYASGRARTPRNPVFRLMLRLLLRGANRRVRALRASGTRLQAAKLPPSTTFGDSQ